MTVLNLSKPLTADDLSTIAAMCGRKVRRVMDLSLGIDLSQPMAEQVREFVDAIKMTPSDWEKQSVVVNLPDDPVAAALVVSEIAGRRGRTPSILRMRPTGPGGRREPAEVISLHEVRKEARHKRTTWKLLGGKQ